jgi:hypothetical protein
MLVATIAVATFGVAPPAHAKAPASAQTVTADQCRRGGGSVYGGKCHQGTWNGQTIQG